jgi:hypothetical protein
MGDQTFTRPLLLKHYTEHYKRIISKERHISFVVSRQNTQTTKTEQADKHTRKETTKTTKENNTGKTQMENMQSVTT